MYYEFPLLSKPHGAIIAQLKKYIQYNNYFMQVNPILNKTAAQHIKKTSYIAIAGFKFNGAPTDSHMPLRAHYHRP